MLIYMVEYVLTVLAIFAILMIPGPTNALLASAARHVGIKQSLRLIPAELVGYLYAIGLWWLFINLTKDIWPALTTLLHLFSFFYVLWLAFSLWKMKQIQQYSQQYAHIEPLQLFYSTFKNPKALLFTAGIFPDTTWTSFYHYGLSMLLFAAVLIPSALFWLYFGDRLLSGKVKGLDQEQLYKHSALFLLLCILPLIARFFN